MVRYERVTGENRSKFEVFRFDGKNGFQRKLDESRAKSMADAFSNGDHCPDILVADVDGRLLIIDGQHRHMARGYRPFYISAKIIPMTMEKAAHTFILMNSTGKRVPLSLRLSVSQDDASVRIRDISKTVGCSIPFAYRAILGSSGKTWLPVGSSVTNKESAMAAFVSYLWLKNKTKPGGIYERPSTVQAVCALVRGMENSKAAPLVERIIRKANFRKDGALAARCGTSGASQKFMRDYLMRVAWRD